MPEGSSSARPLRAAVRLDPAKLLPAAGRRSHMFGPAHWRKEAGAPPRGAIRRAA
jgi:hypothetical protein